MDLLDRVLATGVVISGDITLAIAEVDLVRISLRALVASVGASTPMVDGGPTAGSG
ncbi:gas vesicle protein [Micromonospora parva]|uniref:gas vesicle protein n=1 Tax=Micromonospora parva TaxID=1464048 RepID=UPI0037AFA568